MKISLLICGQMRTFDHPKVLNYLIKLIEKFDCDVFLSTWNNRGISVWSEHALKEQEFIQNQEKNKSINLEHINLIPNIKKYTIDNYEEFINTQCNDEIKSFLQQSSDTLYHSKATSIPSLYKLYSAYQLLEEYEKENNIKYDIVIKTRPDFLHVHIDIEKYFDKIDDTLFHINTGISYCPDRVYEMFFLSSSSIMKTVCESWLNFNQLVNTDYSLHMARLDACRLVYSQCVLNNIKIDTFDKVLGDVLRIENYSDYQSFENMFI
jgi:hypothetical protein